MSSRGAGPTTALIRRVTDRTHRSIGEDVRRLREDAALSRAAVAAAAGIDPSYLADVEDGIANPSIEIYVRIAAVLGADLSVRLYPNTGPAIHDRHQARILEWLLTQAHARWRPFTEVAVRQPARGWIDVVLHDPAAQILVAVEIQSALPRLEQVVRWAAEKAVSLPSWEGFLHLGPIASTSRVLIVRWTRANRDIAAQFGRQLTISYPAHPADAIEALTGARAWPGPALIWVDLRADGVRFVARR